MRGTRTTFAVALFLAVLNGPAEAQVSFANLLEVQSGNLPFRTPENRYSLYDQLHVDARFGHVRFGLRFEGDGNSEDRRTYRALTQRYADWTDSRLRVRVGNFHTIVGRGLVHRSFELPGVVLDKDGARSKYGFSRDLDGALVEAGRGPVEVRTFAGRPNGGELSPGISGVDRYRGFLGGGQIALRLPGAGLIGAGYVRSTSDGEQQQELGTGFAGLDPLALLHVRGAALPLYAEYAQLDRSLGDWWRFGTAGDVPHALYASGSLSVGPVGVTAEWKDYAGFRLGTNDPPSLVREHAWALLNRNTHVLDAGGTSPPTGERGFQLEGAIRLPRTAVLTLNLTRSDLRRFTPGRFEERFVQLEVTEVHGVPLALAAFFDRGEDTDLQVEGREVFGGSAQLTMREAYSGTVEYERQSATRAFDGSFRDDLVSFSAARAGWGSLALVLERSTDPAQEDPDEALTPGIQARRFLAGILNARLSEHHELTLFVGERRGGRACTAGTCYEVLPLKGAELRLTSRF